MKKARLVKINNMYGIQTYSLDEGWTTIRTYMDYNVVLKEFEEKYVTETEVLQTNYDAVDTEEYNWAYDLVNKYKCIAMSNISKAMKGNDYIGYAINSYLADYLNIMQTEIMSEVQKNGKASRE